MVQFRGHAGLISSENRSGLERVQKSAVKIIMKSNYNSYKKALADLGLASLEDRRKELCLNFAKKCLENKKVKHMFPENKNSHDMNTRNPEKFQVQFAKTERFKKSPIIYMQKLLNETQSET